MVGDGVEVYDSFEFIFTNVSIYRYRDNVRRRSVTWRTNINYYESRGGLQHGYHTTGRFASTALGRNTVLEESHGEIEARYIIVFLA